MKEDKQVNSWEEDKGICAIGLPNCGMEGCPNCTIKEAHETELGWCCACEYDTIELENRISQAKSETLEEVVKKIEEKQKHTFKTPCEEWFNEALQNIINSIKEK